MITDKYLLEEIGMRQEITSSMVDRADRRRNAPYWQAMAQAAQSLELGLIFNTQGQCAEGLGSFLGSDIFGGTFCIQSGRDRCPYCGK